ncbi:MAG: sel1 repeat family protein [Clostridiales bacterium]|nr:sel1 repeat family protein [Clostridiales bacterium]
MNDRLEAILQTAYYYREGDCVERNVEESVRLYNYVLKEEPNNARALFGLAYCYYDEDQPTKDTNKWLPLFLSAAQQGHIGSQYTLGCYYMDIRDYQSALYWLHLAADQEDIGSIYLIQHIVFDCDEAGPYMSYIEALRYLHKAYDLKADYAARRLGHIYYSFDKGGIQDYKKAIRFNQEAAVNGDSTAAFYVADSYLFGRGVENNVFEAISWFKFSYDLGEQNALLKLAYLYYKADEVGFAPTLDMRHKIIDETCDITDHYTRPMMIYEDDGKFGAPNHIKANFYAKKCDDYTKKNGSYSEENNAELQLGRSRVLRQFEFEGALYEWCMTPETDIAKKREAISHFERNIEEYADLNSLRTLACLYAGITGFPRFDANSFTTKMMPKDLLINSCKAVVNYDRAFELLDKGIEWGDEICRTICKGLCRLIRRDFDRSHVRR